MSGSSSFRGDAPPDLRTDPALAARRGPPDGGAGSPLEARTDAIDPLPFVRLLEDVRPRVEEALQRSWEAALRQHGDLGPAVEAPLSAARELCLRGGKRLRAALVAVGYQIASGRSLIEPCLPVCCAVELLHSYFLIHDDWMDQDELRRGGPAVHAELARQFGSVHLGAAAAVLAGDYTLALATRELTRADLPPERRAHVLDRFAAMQLDVVAGQQLDVLGGLPGAEPQLDDVYRLKTGSYTVLGPLELGAALCDVSAELRAALEQFAVPLGIAFQLRDDLLGAFGASAQTGKPRGSDLIAGKRTLLLQAALTDARASHRVNAVLGQPGAPAADVEAALDAIQACGARDRVEARIVELTQRSLEVLDSGRFDAGGRALLGGVLRALLDRGV
jgi:geranylgeranyl diphosphate synthase type I